MHITIALGVVGYTNELLKLPAWLLRVASVHVFLNRLI